MRVLVESNYGTTTKPDGLGVVCKLVCSPDSKRNFYWYGNDMELNSSLGPRHPTMWNTRRIVGKIK